RGRRERRGQSCRKGLGQGRPQVIFRLNIVLAVLLLLSSLWLVRASYESRRLFVELEKAQSRSHELQIDYERLEIDKRAQATPLRVEKLAREKLRMFNNTPGVTHYVSSAGAAVGAGSDGRAEGGAMPQEAASQGAQP